MMTTQKNNISKKHCNQVLISYFSDGDMLSDEVSASDRFIRQSDISQHILDGEFSKKELLDLLEGISLALNSSC